MIEPILRSLQALSYSSLLGLTVVFGIAAANAKALPLAHTLRLLPSLYQLLKPRFSSPKRLRSTSQQPSFKSGLYKAAQPALFKHNVMTSRAIMLDLDVNIHKSNSTFFADADISRARLLTSLLSQSLAELGPANFILAGVQCKFQREIRPYQTYTISSRVLAWNDKILYVVTYFLKTGTKLPFEIEVLGGPAALANDEEIKRNVLATMVTKYVFKAGRNTVAPEHIFQAAGLLLNTKEKDSEAQSGTLLAGEDVKSYIELGLEYVAHCME